MSDDERRGKKSDLRSSRGKEKPRRHDSDEEDGDDKEGARERKKEREYLQEKQKRKSKDRPGEEKSKKLMITLGWDKDEELRPYFPMLWDEGIYTTLHLKLKYHYFNHNLTQVLLQCRCFSPSVMMT